jgi:carbonic anhydrase/acetyltransferase-like protein (isoleucine patch superfamily)
MPAIIRPFRDLNPRIAEGTYVADGAVIVGDVELARGASVWYGAVLRGDVGHIRVGARSNIQDLSCIHMTGGVNHTEIGEEVTVGHCVIIHGAKIGHGALIGMGSVILDNAEIGDEALIAAGTIVPPRMIVPPRTLVRGQPGRVIRDLSVDERREGRRGAAVYLELAETHRAAG